MIDLRRILDLLFRPSRLFPGLGIARLRRIAETTPPASRKAFLSVSSQLSRECCEVVRAREAQDSNNPVVLGKIDNDGRLLPTYRSALGFDTVTEDEFVERYRYDLDLVAAQGRVLIRKNYRGDGAALVREWASLARLRGVCAPAVHDADHKRSLLYKSFVEGVTLRQRLVDAGARILTVDADHDPELAGLSYQDRIATVWARGRDKLSAVGDDFVSSLERQVDAIHRSGVTGFSMTYGNVVIDNSSGLPVFVDFDSAQVHRRARGLSFSYFRMRDRELFESIYLGRKRGE